MDETTISDEEIIRIVRATQTPEGMSMVSAAYRRGLSLGRASERRTCDHLQAAARAVVARWDCAELKGRHIDALRAALESPEYPASTRDLERRSLGAALLFCVCHLQID